MPNELTKAVLKSWLQIEMAHCCGYESGDLVGYGSGNSRNGSMSRTVIMVSGPMGIWVP
ncbi:transposase [Mycobacterium malmoense]|uniref:transposase n=1 Tax=Mycobacterium malmoense TaxID=1780 RepID=UPI00111BD782|nr:transposase [Mycobacterium malmoense]QZA17253.1 transposase [Mycobacterium malmoense]UNB94043.1 transposase [Mycobacterium malmoense]